MIKKSIIIAALVGAAIILSGAVLIATDGAEDHPLRIALLDGRNDAVFVEEVYTVKPGDTVWTVAEEYVKKNTYSRRYILEYIEGIKENNPWLVERKSQLQPGDKLVMTYWVKK